MAIVKTKLKIYLFSKILEILTKRKIMKLKQSLQKCHEVLLESENIIICTHEKPDGDAIGSSLALYLYAVSLGKKATIVLNNPAPPNLVFMPAADKMILYDQSGNQQLFDEADAIFILDVGALARIGDVGLAIVKSGGKKVIIDHHEEPEDIADVICVDTAATATGEILYRLFQIGSNTALSKEIAECLYVSILMDTGSFRFDRTGSETHRIVAGLIGLGANPALLYDRVYNNRSLNSMRLEGLARATAELDLDGKFCSMLVRQEFFEETGANKYDTEGFVESMLSIKGVEAGVLITQNINIDNIENEEIRLSFRSKTISVRKVAMRFGGGGHKLAAGGKIYNRTIDEAKEIVLKAVGEFFANK